DVAVRKCTFEVSACELDCGAEAAAGRVQVIGGPGLDFGDQLIEKADRGVPPPVDQGVVGFDSVYPRLLDRCPVFGPVTSQRAERFRGGGKLTEGKLVLIEVALGGDELGEGVAFVGEGNRAL